MKGIIASILKNKVKNVQAKKYPPPVEAAVNHWCSAIGGTVDGGSLDIFRKALLDEIAAIFDSREGRIELHSQVPESKVYNSLEKPGRPSALIRNAMKKAKIRQLSLPEKMLVTISPSEVRVYQGKKSQIIWRAPMALVSHHKIMPNNR